MSIDDTNENFLSALFDLTNAGIAKWTRPGFESGCIYCFVNGEMIVFELRCGDEAEIYFPEDEADVHLISALYRNLTLVWFPSSSGWESLRAFLLAVPEGADLPELRADARRVLLNDLLAASKKLGD